ncbi:hypothetical protein Scep_008522 [Stephania cephalantha]|uniref:HTH myb-type domain-containing protein n=1 Tax=Stephania cephalantha TaxID=152367 RepID=A0AAP0KD19_9MAGN
MASPSHELSQEYCKSHHTYSMLLKSFGDHHLQQLPHDHTQKLEEFLACLEEEWLKIEAFKRELPLCMQLLSNAMEASKQQLQSYRANQGPRLEEFIPLKHSNSEGSTDHQKASNISEKASWMVSAQLWSQSSDGVTKQQSPGMASPKKENDHQSLGIANPNKLSLDDKKRNGCGGGAFLPFSKEKNSTCSSPPIRILADLALSSTTDKEILMEDKKCSESENSMTCSKSRENLSNKGENRDHHPQGKGGASTATQGDQSQTTGPANSQAHRKARRCWSPDLHRRFVNALQMLGGSQVATPKQIRELMKVDGLTNDEVKSHLQKYRLHTRRPSPSPQTTGAPAPQLVVLGSIWVPPEYATAAAAHTAAPAIYSAHPASLASTHYCAPPHDFYPAPPAIPHHHLHRPIHHHHHLYKASSPESEARGVEGERSESIEDDDGKSESGSWNNKGESVEINGGDHHHHHHHHHHHGGGGLASLRDEVEKSSNGSEITLKF